MKQKRMKRNPLDGPSGLDILLATPGQQTPEREQTPRQSRKNGKGTPITQRGRKMSVWIEPNLVKGLFELRGTTGRGVSDLLNDAIRAFLKSR